MLLILFEQQLSGFGFGLRLFFHLFYSFSIVSYKGRAQQDNTLSILFSFKFSFVLGQVRPVAV